MHQFGLLLAGFIAAPVLVGCPGGDNEAATTATSEMTTGASIQRERWSFPAGFLKAGDRARTGDIQLGRLALYQLSYARARLA